MSSKAVEIERKLATGEALLRQAGRGRTSALLGVAVGVALILFRFPYSLEIAILVIVGSCISLFRMASYTREIEDGLIEYRAMKAGLSGKDDA